MAGKTALSAVASSAATCYQGPLAGTTVPLSSLWTTSKTPVILVFLRRLGCALCRVYAQDVEALRVELGDRARCPEVLRRTPVHRARGFARKTRTFRTRPHALRVVRTRKVENRPARRNRDGVRGHRIGVGGWRDARRVAH